MNGVKGVSPIGEQTNQFCRIEDKFLLSPHQAEALQSAIGTRLVAKNLTQKIEQNQIESTYFESPDLQFFRDHMERKSERLKLRLRRYVTEDLGPDGSISSLEVKQKRLGVSLKRRIWLPESLRNLFLVGDFVLPKEHMAELKRVNNGTRKKKIKSRLNECNQLIGNLELDPILKVSYERLAFETADLRITMDQDLKYEMLDELLPFPIGDFHGQSPTDALQKMANRYVPGQHRVLEIKHQNNVPDWLIQFLNDHRVRKTGFSKYCWSVSSFLLRRDAEMNDFCEPFDSVGMPWLLY